MKMRSNKYVLIFLILVFCILSTNVTAEDKLVTLKVRGANINDVLLMLTEQSGINLVPDETVQGQVTIDLRDVNIQDALRTLTIAYGYHFDMIADNIYLVSREGFNQPAEINVKNGRLTVIVENGDIRNILNQIAQMAALNIVMDAQINGTVSANIKDVPLEIGLMSFLQANGFSLSKSNNIYRIFASGKGGMPNNLSISVVDGMVSIDVQQADLSEVLRTISRLATINMVLFSGVRDTIDLKLDNVPLEEVIDVILSGTRFTYKYSEGVYLIGDKNPNSYSANLLTTNEIIPLEYLQVEDVPQLLPNNFPTANVKVIKEQNALMVTGTQQEIDGLKKYINKIDAKIPQIVVDALIIQLNKSKNEGQGIKIGSLYEDNDNEEKATVLFDTAEGQINYKSVLKLPNDFYFKINNLVTQGLATVKARPNITTLNGQQANIDVSTTQYYKIVETDSDGNEDISYESVSAGVTLEVTPWVSSTGEITLNLKPVVSNIGSAALDGGRPPVDRREASTTIRIKDGHTIVLGGLIQDVRSNTKTKVPFFSKLPLIGSLFRTNDSDISQTELVIYITPHVLKEREEDVKEDMQEMNDKVDKVGEGI